MQWESHRWSLAAGAFALSWSLVLLAGLSPVTRTLTAVLGLPEGTGGVVVAAPVLPVGSVLWRALVERSGTYTYPRGGIFGAATALATALVWLLVLTVVYGPRLVATGAVVVGFVLAVALPVGALVGSLAMLERRRASARDGQ